MPIRSALVPLLAFFASTPVLAQSSAHWAQWRGPNFDGSSDATGLPTEWSAEKNVLWKTPLPSWSGATPVVWGDRLFVVSPAKAGASEEPEGKSDSDADGESGEERQALSVLPQDGRQGRGQGRGQRGRGQRGGGGRRDAGGEDLMLLCLSTQDGAVLWERKIDSGNALYRKSNNTSCSPVTDGEHVWTVTGNGQITAHDMAGEVVWKKNLQTEYGSFGIKWGYSSSPLLLDGKLVVQVLHGSSTTDPSYLVAFDGATGKPLWRVERPTDAPRESPDAYTTPLPIGEGEAQRIVVLGGDYVTGHDPESGKEFWRVGGLNPQSAPNYRIVASPLMIPGGVLIAPTRVRPLTAVAVEDGATPTDEDVLWRYENRGAPDVPTPTTDGTWLYLVSDNGLASCVDPATGELVWGPERTAPGTVSASPLVADGKLFVTNEEGTTTVLAIGEEYRELAVNETDGSYTLSSLIACDGRLYLRTEKFLYCIGQK